MGNPKQKWTSEEEEALRAGVAKYGPGKWKFIQKDPEFNKHLHSRSNVDLKDKWRNMIVAAGQGSREKTRAPKARTSQDSSATPVLNAPTPASVCLVGHDISPNVVKDDALKDLPDLKNGPRYNDMIFEALSTTKDSGLDVSALVSFIEKKVEVPQNFRKLLCSRLRRLVLQDKLEKVGNCFRIKDMSLENMATLNNSNRSTLKKDFAIQTRLPSVSTNKLSYEAPHVTLEAATKYAACKIVEAEEMSSRAADAVKEAERIVRMAEEAAEILQFAKEIFERCSRGEVVPIA